MKPVTWDPPALQEFAAAVAASPDPAGLHRAVDEALRDIASGLITHAAVPRTRCRKCVLTRVPYSIVYVEYPAEIYVYALAHHRRRSGYWKGRLP